MKRPFPFYKQYDSMDCGPTCLLMITKYYGRHLNLQSIRDKTNIGISGVSLFGISEAAESIGFRTQGVRLTFNSLVKDALLPCILHWDQKHFVVLWKIKNDNLFVADPSIGNLKISKKEFKEHWIYSSLNTNQDEGIALIIEPSSNFYKEQSEFATEANLKKESSAFTKIFEYISPFKKFIYQLIIGIIITSVIQLALPFLTQSIVDVGIDTSNLHFIYIIMLAQLALLAGRLATDFIRSWILLHISTRINISVLTDFLVKLMKLPIAFFDKKKTGDILQRMNDHQRIETFLTGPSINLLFSLINLVVFSIVLALFNFQIFFVFWTASILYFLWIAIFMQRRKLLDFKRFNLNTREQSLAIQLVQGIREIKLNGVEQSMRWSWEALQAKLFRLNMTGLALNQWQQSGAFFLNEGKNIFVVFLAAKLVISGQMTLGTMLAVQYIVGQLNSPIDQMLSFIQSWQNAKISLGRLNEIHVLEDEEPVNKNLLKDLPFEFKRKLMGGNLDNFSDIRSANSNNFNTETEDCDNILTYNGNSLRSIDLNESSNSIVFKNVAFVYPGAGNSPVLNDINLSIKRGKTTAIVGASGSGKTTLLKLLLKFYEPQKGEINLGNNSLSNISHKVWRHNCGAVMQESFIFSDTIAKNIAIGLERIDTDRLAYSLIVSNLSDFIESLPLGINTKIGEDGIGISMGQKQRILIARAVYRDPEFILLDEATNSLDANNESVIVKNLDLFLKGRTVIIVAHRLSTVIKADQIIVLNKGMISERGTHNDLISLRGEYYALVKNQLELNL